jgi:endonuclease/exonuclease/phosphatase family metal-dependent hydrolase
MGILFGKKRRRTGSRSRSSRISLTRFIGPGITGAAIVGTLSAVITGQVDLSSLDILRGTVGIETESTTADVRPVDLKQLGQKSPDTIRVATFNIQRFGDKKSQQREVMESLAHLIAQFDVVAIQEVQSAEMTPIRVLVDILRASGGRYSATVSERLGRDTYKESYAFVWDETRVRMTQEAYVVQDPNERMPREPMVASFEARSGTPDGRHPFRFTLINVHTSPALVAESAIENELNVLDDVFVRVREYDYQTTGEEDCIMLGDLNVDANNLRELGQIPGVQTIAPNLKTNTRRTKTYDHILIDRNFTREFTGRYGLIDLQQYFGIDEEQALTISDHMPLWAEFSAYESPAPTTSQSNNFATEPQVIR